MPRIPAGMRWIPKGMTVEYLKKATGTLHGVATPDIALVESAQRLRPAGQRRSSPIAAGDAVFRARITMWVSPRR